MRQKRRKAKKRKRRLSSVAGSTYSDVTEELWSQEASQKEACNLPNSAPASPAHDNQGQALETHEEEGEEGELSSSDSSSSDAAGRNNNRLLMQAFF